MRRWLSQAWRWRAVLQGTTGFAAVVQTGVATVMVLMINVITGMVSARTLGSQGRGELSALLLCPQFLSFLFTLGLPSSTIVTIKRRPEEAPGLIGATLLLSMIMGALAALCGSFAMPWLLRQYDGRVVAEARALLLFVMLGVPSTVLVAALQLRDRFAAYNRMRYWQSLVILIGLVVLAAAHTFNPLTGALAYLLPTVPFLGWNVWSVFKDMKPNLHRLRQCCRELLSYGARAHIMDVGNALFGQLDKVVLVAVLAPAAFGVYVVVFNLSRLVTTFANAAIPVLLPRAAGRTGEEVLTLTSRALAVTTLLTTAAVLGFAVLGGIGLRLLYGEPFAVGYWTLLILCVEAALAGSAAVLQQPYLVLNRPGTVATLHALTLCAAGGLIYAGAVRFGSEGAALGLLLSSGLRFALTYAGFRRVLRLPAPRLLPTRADWSGLLTRARASHA